MEGEIGGKKEAAAAVQVKKQILRMSNTGSMALKPEVTPTSTGSLGLAKKK